MSTQTENVPPVGIMLLSVLNLIVGVFAIFAGITIDYIMIGGELTLVSSFQLTAILVGLVQIIAGVGLYTLRSWAWYLAILVTLIGLLINLLIVIIDFNELRFYLLPMMTRIVILAYLMSGPIKKKFR